MAVESLLDPGVDAAAAVGEGAAQFGANEGRGMTLADVKAAQEKWVKNRKYVYGILGDIQDLDLNYLKTLGPIRTVSQEEIFGY